MILVSSTWFVIWVVVSLVQLVNSWYTAATAIIALFLGAFLVDSASYIGHWMIDNYGTENTPRTIDRYRMKFWKFSLDVLVLFLRLWLSRLAFSLLVSSLLLMCGCFLLRWLVLGKKVILPFRVHHDDPMELTTHGFIEANGNTCAASLPCSILSTVHF